MNVLMRFFLKGHVFLYRLTGGKIGGKMGSNPILLLDSIGRKSGQKRTTPLVFFRDGDSYVIIASNGGAPAHPAWYHNLKSKAKTTVQVMDKVMSVTAVVASSSERGRIWPELIAKHEQFRQYQEKTEREIPLVVLTPLT
jgi:deazaflavin-dependent oxidoreductase (nitroreductase family)